MKPDFATIAESRGTSEKTAHTSGPTAKKKMIRHHRGRASLKERTLKNSRAWSRLTKKENGAGLGRAESSGGEGELTHDRHGEAQSTWKKVAVVVHSGAAEKVMLEEHVSRDRHQANSEVQEPKGVQRTRRRRTSRIMGSKSCRSELLKDSYARARCRREKTSRRLCQKDHRCRLHGRQDNAPILELREEVRAGQASKRRKVGTATPSWSVCWHAELVVRGSGCHRDDIGGDVAMKEDSAHENSAGHPSSSGSDSSRRITTKREPREVRDEQTSTTEQHVPRRISRKTTLSEHAVAVTTQEALGGYCQKTMEIADVENNTLNWVSISSAGVLDRAAAQLF